MRKVDASCCLRDIGSVETPFCKYLRDKEIGMTIINTEGLSLKQRRKLRKRLEKNAEKANHNSPCAGRSVREMWEDELDSLWRCLMEAAAGEYDFGDEDPNVVKAQWQGRAEGIMWAIAIIRNGYVPTHEIAQMRQGCRDRWAAAKKEEVEASPPEPQGDTLRAQQHTTDQEV